MSNGFASLGIRESLVQKLKDNGVSEPTPIQKEAIPAVLTGTDLIAQAQTGTGKTLAFVLPMLEIINVEKPDVQGLILTPTRELAIQISSELQKLAPVIGANVLAAYGGQDVERQLRKLEGNIHIVVGTPGRLLDHLRRGSVQFYKLKMLVLDEADQMLHMGFLKEVEDIIAQTSSHRQTLLFSATMPQQVRNLSKAYMRNAQEIEIAPKQVTLKEIEQILVQTTDRAKQDALCEAIDKYKPYLAMIFCRTKRRATALNEALLERGYASDELHGDLSQAKREQVMKRFRDGKIELLVATDIAARGLDVEGVTHVFNYDIPHDAESYIHRIGRTGRAGQTGVAVTFASPRDLFYLEIIEKGIRMKLQRPDQPRRVRSEETEYELPGRGSARKAAHESRGGRGAQRRGARNERQDSGSGRAAKGQNRGNRNGAAEGGRGARTETAGRGAWQHGDDNRGARFERGQRGEDNRGARFERGQRGEDNRGTRTERGQRGEDNRGARFEHGQHSEDNRGARFERGQRGEDNRGARFERGQRGEDNRGARIERGQRGEDNRGARFERGQRGEDNRGARFERGQRGDDNRGARIERGQRGEDNRGARAGKAERGAAQRGSAFHDAQRGRGKDKARGAQQGAGTGRGRRR